MTTGSGVSSAADGFSQHWEALRDDPDIQFAPVQFPERDRDPSWLQEFFRWLGELLAPVGQGLAASWPVLQWVLLALAIGVGAYLAWRLLAPNLHIGSGSGAEDEDEGWSPETAEARELLEEADRLAGQGRYDEATHLLLQRSVIQIDAARPGLIEPSSTAREISALPALSTGARTAFSTIADLVERSLFALRRLSADDWQVARAAYAEFALTNFSEQRS